MACNCGRRREGGMTSANMKLVSGSSASSSPDSLAAAIRNAGMVQDKVNKQEAATSSR